MEPRVIRWLAERNISPRAFEPVLVERGPEVRVELVECHSDDQEWLHKLESALSDEWHVPVRFVQHVWPEDSVSRILEIWIITGAGFSAMMDAGHFFVSDDGITCRFPNAIALRRFHDWGGEPRLRRLWPNMPAFHESVAEVKPPVVDPVIPVVIKSESAEQKSIGRGVPADEAVALKSLPESGEVVVLGRIFSVEVRTGRDGLRHWSVAVTDQNGAVRLRHSERRGQTPFDGEIFRTGQWVKVRGVIEQDKYTEERIIRIRDGGAVEGPPSLDDGRERKRIELHAHSKMSAMDGLVSAKELFEMARNLGHGAIGIVDHGVVQSYPEADLLAKKTGVRAIYGIEAYMVDDRVVPLTGENRAIEWSDRPLVVVDLETTGLSPRCHEAIEIGAVKIQNGRIQESFHRMVAPTRSVSKATENITGIKASDLEGAPHASDVFRDFFQFAEGAVLAAHNARFDMGFLSKAHGALFGPGQWHFPVLDTLNLARIVLPGLKSYGLGPLSQYLKVPLSQHHRALADAEATGHLFLRLMASWEGGTLSDLENPHEISHTVGRPTPVVLFVKDQAGIEALYRLVSQSHLEYFHRVPRIPRRLIEEQRSHWLIGSPVNGGEVAEALLRGAMEDEIGRLADWYDYWEVSPPDALESLAAEENLDGIDGVKSWLEDMIALGQRHRKWVVAVSDVHYLRPEDKVFRDILAQTAKGELHNRHDRLHFRTSQEMEEAFSWLPEPVRDHVVYDAPAELVDSVAAIKPVPDGLYAPNLDEAEQAVAEMPWKRARELYGDDLHPVIQARLDKEIRSIVNNGFSSIYYIAHRLVKKSLDDGYLVGSRGSVGSSLVATLLNITEVNPLPPHYRCPSCRFTEFVQDERVGSGFDLPARACPQCQTSLVGDGQDIPFETFLGFEGDKVPDIDLNFSGEYQPEIHKYTEELFGQGHVFRAGTIATVADKTAYGLVRAWARDVGRDLQPAEVEWLASGITGVKRTTGQHPGGLMVVPQDEMIYRFCPVQRPADDRTSDVVTTHFDYHAIEGRLLKLDLLGHDDPTAIRMLEDLTGISAKDVPFQDEQTMSLFRSVKALGVTPEEIGSPVGSFGIPEFGTRFVRGMLQDTKPESFAELIRISGLSHGTEVWTNNAQDLIRKNIAGLSDVIATRDDIMIYLLNRGLSPKVAFSISESVRKGKGLKADQEQIMREHGVPTWYIESCRKISYLFPKAHAAAYVMMGWRIAWFKVHHPLAYYATYFSVRASDFDPSVVLGGIRQVNQTLAEIEEKGNQASPKEKSLVTVLEIAREMLSRKYRFYGISLETSDATRFLMEDDGLLIPFAALPGLGGAAAQNILTARQEGPFLSVDDLRQRAKLSKSIIDLLRTHGAFKGLGETSQLAFF